MIGCTQLATLGNVSPHTVTPYGWEAPGVGRRLVGGRSHPTRGIAAGQGFVVISLKKKRTLFSVCGDNGWTTAGVQERVFGWRVRALSGRVDRQQAGEVLGEVHGVQAFVLVVGALAVGGVDGVRSGMGGEAGAILPFLLGAR